MSRLSQEIDLFSFVTSGFCEHCLTVLLLYQFLRTILCDIRAPVLVFFVIPDIFPTFFLSAHFQEFQFASLAKFPNSPFFPRQETFGPFFLCSFRGGDPAYARGVKKKTTSPH